MASCGTGFGSISALMCAVAATAPSRTISTTARSVPAAAAVCCVTARYAVPRSALTPSAGL